MHLGLGHGPGPDSSVCSHSVARQHYKGGIPENPLPVLSDMVTVTVSVSKLKVDMEGRLLADPYLGYHCLIQVVPQPDRDASIRMTTFHPASMVSPWQIESLWSP